MKLTFYVTCLNPTLTLTKGKNYQIFEEKDRYVQIVNDNDNKIWLLKNRFSAIFTIEEKNMKKRVICTNKGNFKRIEIGKEYLVEKETKDFFYIRNEKNDILLKYNKKYFKEIIEIPEPVSVKIICIYPVQGELSFKKEYEFTDSEIKDHIMILKNDQGEKKSYLTKRFKF